MNGTNALVQKIIEWAVIAALVGVIGFLVGNSEAATMRAEINALRGDLSRSEREVEALRKVVAERRNFMNGAAGPLNYLCERDDGCRSRFDALAVPE